MLLAHCRLKTTRPPALGIVGGGALGHLVSGAGGGGHVPRCAAAWGSGVSPARRASASGLSTSPSHTLVSRGGCAAPAAFKPAQATEVPGAKALEERPCGPLGRGGPAGAGHGVLGCGGWPGLGAGRLRGPEGRGDAIRMGRPSARLSRDAQSRLAGTAERARVRPSSTADEGAPWAPCCGSSD